MLLLAGDVGGTKTALALVRNQELVERNTYASAEFPSLEAMVLEFLGERGKDVSRACFGVAGPVESDVVRATNLRWVVDARRLEHALGVIRVRLVNDFHALAVGLSLLPASDFAILNDSPSDPHGPWAMIGAGTGLGQAVAVRAKDGLVVVASEGGHTDFAPRNELEIELLRFLLKRHRRVSYERVVSGPGLVAIYEFLRSRSPELESAHVRDEMAHSSGAVAAIVSRHGMAGDDALCGQALSLFASAYGAEAGNLALKVSARGGMFVAGGIAPKILPKMLDGTFMASFIDKGRLSPMLQSTSVKVILNPDAPLLGAAALASGLPL